MSFSAPLAHQKTKFLRISVRTVLGFIPLGRPNVPMLLRKFWIFWLGTAAFVDILRKPLTVYTNRA
jgi:hypothetical protein